MNTLRDYVEWGITHSDKTGSAEGVPLVMENCVKNKKMKQLEVYGESVQNGTPSPEAPVEVESVGEKCTNNLFDKDNSVDLYDGNSSITQIPTDTGVKFSTPPNNGGGYVHLDLGLVSLYAGKTLNATMKAPIVDGEAYGNTRFVVCNSNGSDRIQKGQTTVVKENGIAYIAMTYDVEDIADKHLTMRLYVASGTPSTTYEFNEIMVSEGEEPLSYEPYGKYKIPVTVRGKNLFKPTVVSTNTIRTDRNPSLNGAYGTVIDSTDFSDNKVIVTQTPNSDYNTESYNNGYVYFEIPELVIGKKYRLSFDLNITDNPLNATSLVMYALNSPIGVVSITPNRCEITFTYKPPITGRKPDVELRCGGASFELSNVMITEEGQDDTYEPYIEPITTNVYLNEPLRKIGDYADVIDFKGKKVVRNIDELVFNSTKFPMSKWQLANIGNDMFMFRWGNMQMPESQIFYCGLCNRYSVVLSSKRADKTLSGYSNFDFIDLDYASTSEWVAHLDELYQNGTPLKVIRALATPYEEPITCELPTLPAKTSVVEVDTSLLPSNIKGKYIKR